MSVDSNYHGQFHYNNYHPLLLGVAPEPLMYREIDSDLLKDVNVGYRYMWYSIKNDKSGYDYFSAGKYGRYIYISPDNDTVIVRIVLAKGVLSGGLTFLDK